MGQQLRRRIITLAPLGVRRRQYLRLPTAGRHAEQHALAAEKDVAIVSPARNLRANSHGHLGQRQRRPTGHGNLS